MTIATFIRRRLDGERLGNYNSRWRLKAIELNHENTISSCSSSQKVILKLQNHTVSLFEQGGAPPRLLFVGKAITNNSL